MKINRKKLAAVLLSLTLAGMAAGCAETPEASPGSVPTPESQTEPLAGKVATNGSTSMERVIGALSEAFMNQNSGVDVTYDPTGSGTGIIAAQEGTCDIGLSSRALKDNEKANLDDTIIALDGIAIITNKKNTVKDLSIEQINQLATGAVKNWKEVGGKDAPVVVIGREAGSGTRDGFESIVGCKDKAVYAQELTATGAVIQAVASNENAVGYASLSAAGDTVSILNVGGIAPSEETVLDGSYQVQRPFVMVTKKDGERSSAAQAFLDFALDPGNADIIRNAGAVPVSK